MDKQTVVHPEYEYSRIWAWQNIIYSSKKWNFDTCYNMDDSWKHYARWNWLQMDKYCMTPLTWKWSEVAQSCLTLCDPLDCSLPGFSVHGIFQARVLEWVSVSFSRGSSPPRDWTWVSHIAGRRFTLWATREAQLHEVPGILIERKREIVIARWWEKVIVQSFSHVQLCDPMDCNQPGSSVHGDSPGKKTGVDRRALLQGIFPTQQSNPSLPHFRLILYHLNHQGNLRILEWVAYPFPRGIFLTQGTVIMYK